MRTTAAVMREPGAPFSIETVEIGEPRDDELLVRIEAVGICHTDLVFAKGALGSPFPMILGHEGAGIVERVGAAIEGFAAGDKVLLTFDSCGECRRCATDEPSYCERFSERNYGFVREDGSSPVSDTAGSIAARFFGQSSFARYAVATSRNVVKLPPDADLATLAPLGCGVQTGFGGVTRSLCAEAGSSIVIIGGGAVGLSAVLGAVHAGCRTIVLIEPREERRELGLKLGAHLAIDPAATDIVEAVRALKPAGVDYVFDSSGVTQVVQDALGMLGSKGVLGLVGVPGDLGAELAVPLVQTITYGHSVRGIIEGDSDPQLFLPELVAAHAAGKLPIEQLITKYPFDRINEAIADGHSGRCIKAVLLLDENA